MIGIVTCALRANADRGDVVVGAENLHLEEQNSVGLAEGDYIRLLVRDSGSGIPSEQLKDILDPLCDSCFGTLSPAVCNTVVTRHGGLMVMSSSTGLGSAYNVYLPASPGEEPPPSPFAEGELSGRRVLVMDDDPFIQQVASEMLAHPGCGVVTTGDGSEAVEAYARSLEDGRPFDLVLVDLTVPGGKGGLETLAGIRELDREVRAIICSGYFSDPQTPLFREHGFSAALPKPYDLADLEGALRSALED